MEILDPDFEVKCIMKFGICSDKVLTIVKSWKHKQSYSSVYNKKRRLEGHNGPHMNHQVKYEYELRTDTPQEKTPQETQETEKIETPVENFCESASAQ
jgi:hypothetical protein